MLKSLVSKHYVSLLNVACVVGISLSFISLLVLWTSKVLEISVEYNILVQHTYALLSLGYIFLGYTLYKLFNKVVIRYEC